MTIGASDSVSPTSKPSSEQVHNAVPATVQAASQPASPQAAVGRRGPISFNDEDEEGASDVPQVTFAKEEGASNSASAAQTDEAVTKPKISKPATKRVVVLGAGMAGLLVAQQLRRKGLTVTLVTPRDYFVFLPRLTELVAKTAAENKVVLPLRQVWLGELRLERATLVNPEENSVILESGASIEYDVLVIAVGSETNYFNTPGSNHAFAFYTREDADRLFSHVDTMLDADEGTGGTHTFAVVGGGPTGVEVANILADKVKQRRKSAKLLLIERMPSILGLCPQLAGDVRAVLEGKGIEIITSAAVSNITPLSVELQRENQNKETIPCYTTVWAAGCKPAPLVIASVSLSARGEIPSSPTLQVPDHPNIFALGDVAATGKPKTAQAAVQQGQHATENILRFLDGKPGKPFVYKDRGVVIALEGDTCGLFFGRKFKGFIAKTMRDTYYSFSIGQYK